MCHPVRRINFRFSWPGILIVAAILVLLAQSSFAATVQLAWDANLEPNVAGYKVYYQADTSELPFTGQEAAEGPSPIDIGNSTSTEITLPDDGRIYYFAVTAYDTYGYESSYSNVVATDWVPVLIAPGDSQQNIALNCTFSWTAPPDNTQVVYTLYFGTDPTLETNQVYASKDKPMTGNRLMVASFGIFLLPMFLRRKTRHGILILLMLASSLFLYACGGGGGGGTVDSTGSVDLSPSSSPEIVTYVVDGLDINDFDVTSLEPGTRYYWKVVADDGTTYRESTIQSFVTAE